ncbi:DNA polymerase III subunit alpha [Rodentibacter pneumotropicus]|uniref:DNA polymerase III subunit alpha n=1 Tax=Rodentibacter pneumotropicus TaxID=758 RepID=A0A448MJJ3_9PAST|nr:DNA polymerase III subunit alpha [Rodentibacter pneumotropicus]
MPSQPRFVHLRTHSDFSMIDGIAKVKPLVKTCAANNMVAMALTDFSNFCGVVRFMERLYLPGLNRLSGRMCGCAVSYAAMNYLS